MCRKILILRLAFGIILLNALQQTMAQRPSYAGQRPTGGLSQKDKYHNPTQQQQQQTGQNPAGSINNRFGAPNTSQIELTNSIPYGATQRPPVGWPIVTPQAQYVPLNNNVIQQTPPQFALNNRISGNDIGDANGNESAAFPASNGISSSHAGAAANAKVGDGFNRANFMPQPGFQSLPPPAPINGLPLDAHGDQALIDFLNTVPLDQRPFWFLNYLAIEAQRNSTRPTFTGAVGARGSFFG